MQKIVALGGGNLSTIPQSRSSKKGYIAFPCSWPTERGIQWLQSSRHFHHCTIDCPLRPLPEWIIDDVSHRNHSISHHRVNRKVRFVRSFAPGKKEKKIGSIEKKEGGWMSQSCEWKWMHFTADLHRRCLRIDCKNTAVEGRIQYKLDWLAISMVSILVSFVSILRK